MNAYSFSGGLESETAAAYVTGAPCQNGMAVAIRAYDGGSRSYGAQGLVPQAPPATLPVVTATIAHCQVQWAHVGSNHGPPACEAGALPLSYAPRDGLL